MKNYIRNFFAILFFGCVMLAVSVQAQTNSTLTNSVPSLPSSTAADIGKVLSDFGFHVSLETIGMILVIGLPFFKAVCAYLRKLIPKTALVNNFGLLLAHGAGVDSPTLTTLAAEIPPAKIIPPVKPTN